MNDEWMAGFEEWLGRTRGENTVKAYLADLAVFCRWWQAANGELFALDGLNGADVRGFLAWSLHVRRAAAATCNRRRAMLMVLCGYAASQGVQLHFDWREIPAVDAVQQAPEWLDRAEYYRLQRWLEQSVNAANTRTRQARAYRDWAMVGLMMYAGLREGEVCGLRMVDVVLGERSGEVVVLGKGNKVRHVPLNSEARRALRLWIELAQPVDLVFEGLSERGLQKRVAAMGQAARIEGLHPHALRHTFAKRLVDAGQPLSVVQSLLGHASVSTTMVYVQPGRDDCAVAVESMLLGAMARKEYV